MTTKSPKIRRCLICPNSNRTATDVSYFRLPGDQDIAEKWLINLRRTDLIENTGGYGFICSDHFPPDRMFMCKSNDLFAVRRLKRGALPYKTNEDGQIEDTSDKSDEDGDEAFDCSIADMLQQKMYSEDDPSGLETNGFADNEMSTNDVDEDFNLDLFDDVDPKEIEQYKTHFPKLAKIADSKSHCTSCQYHIGTAPINEAFIKMHPILRVTQCKRCFTFYNSGEFERGEDGSELYCRWCGQGGEVYCCSNCPYVFCRRCIVHNLSRNMVTEIQNNENWNCFACAPQCMIPLRASHWALVNFIEKQKRQIANQSTDEKELNELMSKDISRCCSGSKKRVTLKRKVENTAVITPPPEKKKTITPSPAPKILNTTLAKTPIENKSPSEDDDSVAVQCTPDILSLFNEEQPSSQPPEAPPLRLIRREVVIRPNQSGISKSTPPPRRESPPPKQPTPPPKQITPPSLPIKPTSPLPVNTTSTTSNPVYHTINGFRIDLNTAAQQETYRLPNGKLIQVKKQTPSVTQSSSTPPERTAPVISRPSILPVRPLSLPPNRPHMSVRNSVGPVRISRPQFQIQQRQPIQIQTRFVGNNQIRVMNGPIVQQLNAAPPPMNPNHPPPLVFRTGHGNTPVGKARTQFEERVDNSMEVCQHIIGKINTLTNSSSYKKVKSLMDLKDLTIHLSYLLTYAIGRFKTLQEKCIEDMKNMGFDPDNATGAASDDDIEIVEPKTTTINLDSDEEDSVPTTVANVNNKTNHTESQTPVSNGGENIENAIRDQTNDNSLVDNLPTNNITNDSTKEQNAENANSAADGDLVDLIDEPMEVTEENEGDKNENNDEEIVQVVEITENQNASEEPEESSLVAPNEMTNKDEVKCQEQNTNNSNKLDPSIDSTVDEPMDVTDASSRIDKSAENILNNDEDIVQVVEIAENDDDKNETEISEKLDQMEDEKKGGEREKETEEKDSAKESKSSEEISSSIENTTEVVKANEVSNNKAETDKQEMEITQIDKEENIEELKSNIDENNIKDMSPKKMETVEDEYKENISEILEDKDDDALPDVPTDLVDKSALEISIQNIDDAKSDINDTDENIPKMLDEDNFKNVPVSENSPEKNISKDVSEEKIVKSPLKTLDGIPAACDTISQNVEQKIVEELTKLSETTINDETPLLTKENTVEDLQNLPEKNIDDEIPIVSEVSCIEEISKVSEGKIIDEIQTVSEQNIVEPPIVEQSNVTVSQVESTGEKIINLPENKIFDNSPVEQIPDVPEENIIDAISGILCNKLTNIISLPDKIDDDDRMCVGPTAGEIPSTLLDDIIMNTLE